MLSLKRHRRAIAAALLAALAWAGAVRADEIWLKNGVHLTGTIGSLVDGKLVLKTDYAGDITVAWDQIASLKTDKPLPFVLKDESVLVGTLDKSTEDGQAKIRTDIMQGRIRLGDVASINKPEKPPVEWTGYIRLGVIFTEGNTETREANASALLQATAESLRVTVRGNWAYGEDKRAEGRSLNKRKALGEIKLDFFLVQRLYVYANALFEHDTFADIDLRTAVGGGAGYDWFDGSSSVALKTEAGLSYIVTDFDDAEDDETLSLRFAWAFSWKLIVDRLTFFHFGEAYPSVEDIEDIFVKTTTGLRASLAYGFSAAVIVEYDWDNQPAADTERSDLRYIFALGYDW